MTWEHPLHPEPTDPTTLPPEVSRLMDLQEEILDAAQATGRPELRQALADLFMLDDLGIAERAHREFAWLAAAIRGEVGRAPVEIDSPKEGA